MSSTKTKKNKALKSDGNGGNCFFKAFFAGIVISFLCLIILCMAVSGFMASRDDSTGNMGIISPVVTVISLVAGGFVCGKTGKGNGVMCAFLCGCACLGICYVISAVLELGTGMDAVGKTLMALEMLLSPVVGAKIASGGKEKRGRRRVKG